MEEVEFESGGIVPELWSRGTNGADEPSWRHDAAHIESEE